MTEIRNSKQKKDERRTSNAPHRTSKIDVASLRFFNKTETPKADYNSTLEVRFLIRFWSLDVGIYFSIENLVLWARSELYGFALEFCV